MHACCQLCLKCVDVTVLDRMMLPQAVHRHFCWSAGTASLLIQNCVLF